MPRPLFIVRICVSRFDLHGKNFNMHITVIVMFPLIFHDKGIILIALCNAIRKEVLK